MKLLGMCLTIFFLVLCCDQSSALIITPEYSYVNESVNISYVYTGNVNITIAQNNSTFTTLSNNSHIVFPHDFSGASSIEGNYSISIRADNGTLLDNGTMYIRPEPVATFVVGSDFHFVNGSANHVQNEWVADINDEKWFRLPDAIFVNGDLSEDKYGLVDAKHAFDELDTIYYPMCSNHDSFPENLSDRGNEYYKIFGGPYNYNVTINGINFICMSSYMANVSLMSGFDRYITYPISRAWFDSVSNDSMPTFLIYHFPLLNTRSAGGAYNFGSMNDANADLVREIMESNEVVAEISGHNHIVSHMRQNNVSYICEGTVQSPLYYYQYYEVYNDHVNVHTIRQNDTPITSYVWTTSTDTLHPTPALYHEGNESERDFSIYFDPIIDETVGGDIIQMQVTYFNPDNATCNMAFTVDDSTPLNWWNFTLSNVTNGVDYAVYDTNPETLMDRATASGGNAIFNISYLPDGEYWIVEYQPEIYWSSLDPSNTSCYGRFEISNAAMGQNWSIKLDNVTSGYTYKLFSNDGVMYATSVAGDNVSLNTTGLRDGWYWIGYINSSDSFVPTSIVVGVSFVIGSAIIASFIDRFRRRE